MIRTLIVSVLLLTASSAFAWSSNQGGSLYAPNGQYLGHLNNNPYDSDSVSNPYGQYGNPYSANSVNNPYSEYGNPYSQNYVPSPYHHRNAYGR